MAAFETRGESAVRLTNHFVLVVSLLVLSYSWKSLAFEIPLGMLKERLEGIFEETVTYEKEEQKRNETISWLLEEARSLTNQKQMEKFKQILQGLVNEADRQKIKEKRSIAAITEQITLRATELYPMLQLLKSFSSVDPLLKKRVHIAEQAIKKVKTYTALKTKLFAGDAKNAEKNMNDILHILKSLHELKDEL